MPDGDFLALLRENKQSVIDFFHLIALDRHDYRYAAGKWTPKQLLLHLTDAERVFSYRALTLGRGDTNAVFPNMDENLFAENGNYNDRSMEELLSEFDVVREATIHLFSSLSATQLVASGSMAGHPVTAIGYGYAIIGHTLHHMQIIRERYLTALPA